MYCETPNPNSDVCLEMPFILTHPNPDIFDSTSSGRIDGDELRTQSLHPSIENREFSKQFDQSSSSMALVSFYPTANSTLPSKFNCSNGIQSLTNLFPNNQHFNDNCTLSTSPCTAMFSYDRSRNSIHCQQQNNQQVGLINTFCTTNSSISNSMLHSLIGSSFIG